MSLNREDRLDFEHERRVERMDSECAEIMARAPATAPICSTCRKRPCARHTVCQAYYAQCAECLAESAAFAARFRRRDLDWRHEMEDRYQ